MKIDNLDLSLGGNVFNDDGYRYLEITERKRFNVNSTYKSKSIEGLSYGLNANFLFQTTGRVKLTHPKFVLEFDTRLTPNHIG